jgi:lysyl-tRNA synthetase class 2
MPVSTDWRPSADLATLRLRAGLLARARDYFARSGALEVETPLLVRAGVTDIHIETLEVRDADGRPYGFLHTSPEYAMKRLLAAGAGDISQISHVFRGGERGARHSPEFTMIEWYRVGWDDESLMDDVERLVATLLETHVPVVPARRITYSQAFVEALGIEPLAASASSLRLALEHAGVHVPESLAGDRDALLDLGLSQVVAPGFPADRLTFVARFPATQAALARIEGDVARRFEAFWGGLELANGFHELGDPHEQSRRFLQDRQARAERGLPDRAPDERLLAALAAGLPDCAGVALGFDRLVMIAAGKQHIDDVLAFTSEQA